MPNKKFIIYFTVLLISLCSFKNKWKQVVDNTNNLNIIAILTDDQQINSLSCYDEDCAIQTLNIDKLTDHGVLFNNGFVASPICAVSRTSIITGHYACNNRIQYFG